MIPRVTAIGQKMPIPDSPLALSWGGHRRQNPGFRSMPGPLPVMDILPREAMVESIPWCRWAHRFAAPNGTRQGPSSTLIARMQSC
jgi:hypothetical protein